MITISYKTRVHEPNGYNAASPYIYIEVDDVN